MSGLTQSTASSATPERSAGAAVDPLRGWVQRHCLAVPSLGWWLLFFAVPLGILVVYSFGQINLLTYDVSFGWTFDNYSIVGDPLIRDTVLRSVLIAMGATAVCLIFGFPIALFVAVQRPRVQQLMILAILVPWWTSFVVRTYAWTNILKRGGPLEGVLKSLGLIDGPLDILYSPWSIGIGMMSSYLPIMILPLFVALERIDDSLLAAAADLGANTRRTVLRVVIPLAKPGIYAGCLLVLIPALGEYVVPAILGGEKTLMFGNIVADSFLTVGNYPEGAALSATFMVVVAVVVVTLRRRLDAEQPMS